jgi:8-oxo-dGTP pyrophosphatase MutT (NUDIX family)
MNSRPIERLTARVIVLDARHRVLLLASRMPDGAPDGRLWVAPGGALEPGETWEQAARRELREETGLDLSIGPCVWHRDHSWYWASQGAWYRSIEHFFVVRTEVTDVDTVGWTPQERDVLITFRWWTVEELAATRDVIAPRKLAVLLPPLLAGQIPTTPIVLTE